MSLLKSDIGKVAGFELVKAFFQGVLENAEIRHYRNAVSNAEACLQWNHRLVRTLRALAAYLIPRWVAKWQV